MARVDWVLVGLAAMWFAGAVMQAFARYLRDKLRGSA